MHDLNPRRLNHLVALSEEGSFARAAARVHLSQPALSRSIQSLEEELGVKLFDRAARGVTATAAGVMVVERAKRVLVETHRLERDVQLLKSNEIGELALGLGPYCAELLLPDLLVEFAQRYPGISVRVEISDGTTLVDKLAAEQLDLVVTDQRGPLASGNLSVHPLPRQESSLYVRATHPLLAREQIAMADLRDYPIVSVPVPPYLLAAVRRVLKLRPHEEFRLQAECGDLSVLKEIVRQTDAIMFATTASVTRGTGEALVPLRPVDGPDMGLEFGIAHLSDRTLSPASQTAIMMIRDVLRA
ncbi:LysR family transcriptional regulator [Burkholderia territorii]|uniref:LysR family transcriptional regulator n=1 Tax=Burkholderia territorii TaxID=1503055 RepID=UPI0009C03515|nr:LysR family transcriptional regulator [Burkholderia territorii]